MSVKIQAPIKTEVKIIVADDEGNFGEVSYSLTAMSYPTKEGINEVINEVSKSDLLKNNNMRIASKEETFDFIMREATGSNQKIAMPRTKCENYWD